VALVAIYDTSGVDHADMEHASILYDSGSEFDFISTDYIRSRREPEYARSRQIIATSITGAPIHREGEVRIRWYDSDYTDTKLMNTTCQIVESKLFDIIIGRATLESLQLFVRNPALIGPVLTSLPTVAGNVLLQTFPLDD
jgi:hypothetical protein